LKAIQDKYGNDAIAWLGTGQICTEEMAFLGALAKFGMGMLHGDGNTRQCMATAATAYKQSRVNCDNKRSRTRTRASTIITKS